MALLAYMSPPAVALPGVAEIATPETVTLAWLAEDAPFDQSHDGRRSSWRDWQETGGRIWSVLGTTTAGSPIGNRSLAFHQSPGHSLIPTRSASLPAKAYEIDPGPAP